MDLETDGDELTIKRMIQLELVAVRAVLDTLSETREEGEFLDPQLVKVHDELVDLLDRLEKRPIAPEHAEMQWAKLRDEWTQE
jgi:hypothetical protein